MTGMSVVVYLVFTSSDEVDSVWADEGKAETRANEITNSMEDFRDAVVCSYILNIAKGAWMGPWPPCLDTKAAMKAALAREESRVNTIHREWKRKHAEGAD